MTYQERRDALDAGLLNIESSASSYRQGSSWVLQTNHSPRYAAYIMELDEDDVALQETSWCQNPAARSASFPSNKAPTFPGLNIFPSAAFPDRTAIETMAECCQEQLVVLL